MSYVYAVGSLKIKIRIIFENTKIVLTSYVNLFLVKDLLIFFNFFFYFNRASFASEFLN